MPPGFAVFAALCLTAAQPPDDDLLTVAERSGWQATARYDEVMAMLGRLETRSPVMHVAELGTSVEGRSIPLVVLADPPVRSPLEARTGGRAVVFAFGNIHAGEVCGKEALLMLARELALEPDHPLLDRLVVVLAPIFNADGNERVDVDNRPGQIGPPLGMGERPNAQGLDLNRDWVKLESPEARALVRFLTVWNPHVTVDTHTTNGSRHRYPLTFAAPLNPSGHPEPIHFVRDEMLPEISERLRTRHGYETFFYGNFNEDRSVWETYSALPRFGGPYRGLRGQMSILSEAYAYAPYRERVLVTHAFVREILRYTAEHRQRITGIDERVRRESIEAGLSPRPDDLVGIRHRLTAFAEPAIIKTFVDDVSSVPQDLSVEHRGRYEATLSVPRPHAYVLGPGLEPVVRKLRAHGIAVQPWRGDATVEVYTVTSVSRSEREFQGHRRVEVDVESTVARRSFTGGVFVSVAQPLGTLAVYLLEPRSEDGLAAWNFLDDHLAVGAEYPVYRVRSPGDLSP
jgi:hypothetical protein